MRLDTRMSWISLLVVLPFGILTLLLPQPTRVPQALPSDLDFTIKGCLNQGIDTPEWCGPPAQAQGPEVLRQYREHIRREIRTVKRVP